jgi:predicted LPLAT superfamily acyltransferase
MSEEKEAQVQAQGIFDLFNLFDKETVTRIKEVVASIDPDVIKNVFDCVTVDDDGWINVKIKLSVRP